MNAGNACVHLLTHVLSSCPFMSFMVKMYSSVSSMPSVVNMFPVLPAFNFSRFSRFSTPAKRALFTISVFVNWKY